MPVSSGKSETKTHLIEAELLILAFAFVASFFGGLSVTIDLGEYWRLIAIIEANPNRYLEYLQNAIIYLILPPAVALAFNIIAFMRERKSPTEVLKLWLLRLACSGFFFFWGVYALWWTYTKYIEAMQWATMDIMSLIETVYMATSIGYILWMFTGLFFMLSPIFKIVLRRKNDDMPFYR